MLGVQLTELLDGMPAGVEEALDLVAGFDDALTHGFARLGEERGTALAALAGSVAATPLGERVREASGKVAAGSVSDEHLAALAGARTALFGAVHDALLARFDTALGRARAPWEEPPEAAAPAAENLLGGCRSWLLELAVTGWRGVDHDLVSAADQTVEALLAEPGLRRLAVLLDGLAAELRASSPVATMERLPVRRWADLWSRALLLARPGGLSGAVPSAETVSGRLLVLGADVHEHGTAVQVQVHGVLEPAGGEPPRLVRTAVTSAKVDTIVGPALWRLLGGHPVLLTALAERRALDVTDLPLLGGGDLVWHDDRARAGEPADPFTTARLLLGGALAPAVPPLERHPVRIAEPVLVEGYTATAGDDGATVTFDLGGGTLAVDVDRLPACGPLTPELVAASSACLGLVRWDGGRWTLQPLAVQATVKRKTVAAHTGDWALGPTDPKVVKAEAKAGDAVAVLRERAGRLLRR
ncbi:AcrR family transcriptional regulator [Streptosporangium becharense]|uniref:AcrR family transcriptional regulator n=1 Tax=Streptosporangium becharense TaxID=1816182 RepID=A0A7W9IJH1_9ACTN|nr:hypothetical protein [Streptosporangium becharense]MBB2911058.1 AcrR family transcriptional regulator [Streptosporangium becharense]MBB5821884.1 AcrR family transcriptional regulator [Streptosporangium becharense]